MLTEQKTHDVPQTRVRGMLSGHRESPPLRLRLTPVRTSTNKTGSMVGTELDSLVAVAERRTQDRLLSILDNIHHPLHSKFTKQRKFSTERALTSTRRSVITVKEHRAQLRWPKYQNPKEENQFSSTKTFSTNRFSGVPQRFNIVTIILSFSLNNTLYQYAGQMDVNQ
ncbi:uncharacterized protein LOC123984521 isoform X1 [Tachysurus ichikawai]